ncbi:hypothetical protein BC938DRAFT_477040 [Jimgerdemannia flammicorona]|uniref:Uncharacterized protein n=1 Tax=Jimgerdemannia flammicorona TaxID=994334 RepID=A0A433QPV8_9FUNG|nr:hypothetical protein BC938DRAFT_477040 [Jimgerdemannia flammicorona]
MGATTSKQVVRKFPQTAKPEILASKPSASPSSVAPLEQHASGNYMEFRWVSGDEEAADH